MVVGDQRRQIVSLICGGSDKGWFVEIMVVWCASLMRNYISGVKWILCYQGMLCGVVLQRVMFYYIITSLIVGFAF